MPFSKRQIILFFLAILSAIFCTGAPFGTVVPIRGTVSDIALDELRGHVYAANFSASQVEVMNTSTLSLQAPMPVPLPPSCVAMSPDNRFLVVGEYANTTKGGFTVFDLSAGTRQDVTMDGSALTVAFGAGSQAFMVTTTGAFLINPFTAQTTPVAPVSLTSLNLPVPLATFPPQIIQASAGVSGDGTTIAVLATAAPAGSGPVPPAGCTTVTTSSGYTETCTTITGSTYTTTTTTCITNTNGAPICGTPTVFNGGFVSAYLLLRYSVATGAMTVEAFTTSPPLGPVAVAVDQNATNILTGWVLFHHLDQSYNWAQFANVVGTPNIGTNAWDEYRNVIYAQQAVAGDGPVLHIVATDNLTVLERIQLPENLAGHSLITANFQTMYSVSISGVTVLPIGKLSSLPQITTKEEDLVFQGDACNRAVITQTLDITGTGDFTLSLPSGTSGVRLLTTSGVAPASVQIQVDPVVFQSANGTTVIPLTITTAAGVNLPFPVRLLINTRDYNQRGTVVNVPGKLVDMMADPVRNRVYIVRQDKNLVLVYDSTTLLPIASLRTGNTPMKMSISTDQRYLIVGNDNSQIASVFDLEALQAVNPILFPFGHYPRTIGVSLTDIFATARVVSGPPVVDRIDFANGVANPPASLGIYTNTLTSPDGALAEAPGNVSLMLVLPDGNVLLYDTSVATWVDSRKDLGAIGGAYGAFSNNLFLADINLLNIALVPIGQFSAATGSSSGMGVSAAGTAVSGLRTTAQTASGPGLIERVDLNSLMTYHGTALTEAPLVTADLTSATVGVIGQSILPFIRTLAIPPDQSSILLLTISGITKLTPSFDAITPIPTITSVTNSADGSTAVAPGGLVQIAGTGLAPFFASASGLPLPTSLADTCVTVNTVALPLFSVSPGNIMAELPFVPAGPSTIIVRDPGGISSAYGFTILPEAPAIFRTGAAGSQTGLATVVRDDNQELVDFTNPIHPNESITIYLTGMGTTTPLPALGAGAPASPLDFVDATPAVSLGTVNLGVTFAGLVPGEVGVYQINAQVPGVVQAGTSIPLTITQGGSSTTLAVRVVTP